MFGNLDQTVLLFAFNRLTQIGKENEEDNISCEYSLDDGLVQSLGNATVTPRGKGYYIMNVSAAECDGIKTFDLFPECSTSDILVIAVYHNRTLVRRSRTWINDLNETLNFEEQIA